MVAAFLRPRHRRLQYRSDKAALSTGGGFVAQHDRWITNSGVNKGSPVAFEHEVLSRALQYGVTWGHLNLRTSAMAEFLFRRMQLQEDVVVENPQNPVCEGAEYYMGVDEKRGGASTAPSLRQHASAEIGRDAAILKEKRKAQEEAKSKKAPKGADGK